MIRSTQRKMLRLIVQTKRKYKKKTQSSKNEKDGEGEKENHRSSNTDCDQDSNVSFMKDTNEEIDAAEIEEEEWIEYVKQLLHFMCRRPADWLIS